MSEETIVFLDRATIAPQVELRRPAFPHRWIAFDRTEPHEIIERAREASIVVVNKVKLTAETIAALPKLKLVSVSATGTDNVDKTACAARGIAVRNVVAYAVHSVPEHTFALILALRRQLFAYRAAVADGAWQRARQFSFFTYPISDLAGSTLGVVGRGAIGQSVAKLGEAFGMRVLFAGRKGQARVDAPYTPFDEVLAEADVLTLHCPLTPETRNLVGAAELARMKPTALLINASRGGLVEETALVEAVRNGTIAGAGFDVATVEPPPADHPYMSLLDHPAFILTPHTAWASDQAMQALADQLIDRMESFVLENR